MFGSPPPHQFVELITAIGIGATAIHLLTRLHIPYIKPASRSHNLVFPFRCHISSIPLFIAQRYDIYFIYANINMIYFEYLSYFHSFV